MSAGAGEARTLARLAVAGLRVEAPAKVNLGLAVGPRRPDGYHDVRTILQTIELCDTLTLRPDRGLTLSCDDPGAGPGSENLALRAAVALREAAGIADGVRLRLHKRIPAQSGLGGGSADAAAALVGCARLWGLDWPLRRLEALGAALGADVPFFLRGGTALARGRGDDLDQLVPLPGWPVVVARPPRGSATAAAYATLDALGHWPHPDIDALLAAIGGSRPSRGLLAPLLGNAFEAALGPTRPDLARLRSLLARSGATAVLLAGSGAALFALGPSRHWARAVAAGLRRAGFWAVAARLRSHGVRVLG